MLNSCSHEGNINESHNEISLHNHQMAKIKQTENTKNKQGCGKPGRLINCLREFKLVQLISTTYKVEHTLTQWQ